MNQDAWKLLCELNRVRPDGLTGRIALQCAPLLVGMKPSNLLTAACGCLAEVKRRLWNTDIAVQPLYTDERQTRTKRTDLSEFENIKIKDVTQEYIQEFINDKAKNKAPKTVRNVHGLISAVLSQYRPDMRLTTVLPKKVRPDLYIPSDCEIKRLMQHITGTEMELPILLAAFGPMRRGEIAALTMDNIVGNRVHVCKNMVLNDERRWIIKQPKSYAGDRFIDYPDFVAEKWQGITGNITDLNPNIITSRFWHILKNAGLPHFRFHDLRHYSASIQHALGIPDAYIMQRGGWQTDGVLKAVYRHAMNDRQTEMNNIANAHFSDLCNTKCNT